MRSCCVCKEPATLHSELLVIITDGKCSGDFCRTHGEYYKQTGEVPK